MSAFEKWFSLDGQVAFVTGAGSGLGRAIALGLAEAGADIVCCGRRLQNLEETCHLIERTGRRALAIEMDVGSSQQIKDSVARAAAWQGRIHILVNSAGVMQAVSSLSTTEEEWNRVIRTNLTGTFLCSQAIAAHMIEHGGGKIISVGSIFGSMGTTHCLAYSCSKAAIDEMTRSLAVEWARYAICVNAILPGHFETDMSAGILADPKTSKRIFERMPIRRAGRPDELKPLAVYLASRSSDYVTGQTFCIDGGYSIALYY